jgi:hypothetical protein
MTKRSLLAGLLLLAACTVLALWGDPFGLQLAGYLPMLVIGWIAGSADVPSASTILSDWALCCSRRPRCCGSPAAPGRGGSSSTPSRSPGCGGC